MIQISNAANGRLLLRTTPLVCSLLCSHHNSSVRTLLELGANPNGAARLVDQTGTSSILSMYANSPLYLTMTQSSTTMGLNDARALLEFGAQFSKDHDRRVMHEIIDFRRHLPRTPLMDLMRDFKSVFAPLMEQDADDLKYNALHSLASCGGVWSYGVDVNEEIAFGSMLYNEFHV